MHLPGMAGRDEPRSPDMGPLGQVKNDPPGETAMRLSAADGSGESPLRLVYLYYTRIGTSVATCGADFPPRPELKVAAAPCDPYILEDMPHGGARGWRNWQTRQV